MKCSHPVEIMTKKWTDKPILAKRPCGQCAACRINYTNSWVMRNRLESRLALTSSFWTLTYRDADLPQLTNENLRHQIRKFFDALRKSENRAGNTLPIRYFGCFEYGETFGRPHFHLLIYNVVANYLEPQKYRRGMPLPTVHLPAWPYGHICPAEFNSATVAYTASYLLPDKSSPDYQKPPVEPFMVKSVRPGIGFTGLRLFAENLAAKQPILSDKPNYLALGGRTYALSNYCKEKFCEYYRQAGGRFLDLPDINQRAQLRLASEMVPFSTAVEERRYLDKIRRLETGRIKKRNDLTAFKAQAAAIAVIRKERERAFLRCASSIRLASSEDIEEIAACSSPVDETNQENAASDITHS